MKLKILTKLPLLLILLFLLSASAGAAGEQSIPLPVMTETDCEWDEAGNLVRETAHTLDGKPEAIREILEPPFRYWKLQSQRGAGDRPLPAEELRERLDRADSAGKLSLSEEAGELALLIHQGGLRLEPAVARRVAA